MLIADLDDEEKIELEAIRLRPNVEVNTRDVRSIFSHVRTAFRGSGSPKRVNARSGVKDTPKISIDMFLPYAFHSNVRGALGFVCSAMESWALEVNRVVEQYLYLRDKKLPIHLPPFTLDELILLGAVGEHSHYDHTKESGLFNVYCFRHSAPDPKLGRFPLLIFYRILQYFSKYGRSTKAEFMRRTKCFGYTKVEKERMLRILIDALFIESPDGENMSKIKIPNRTKKLEYYYSTVSVLLVYLENIRNDSIVEYECKPHEVREPLMSDLIEIENFIEYVLSQEILEFAYMKARGNSHLRLYQNTVYDTPISVRMFGSVVFRSNMLMRSTFERFSAGQQRELAKRYADLKRKISNASRDGQLHPRVRHYTLEDLTTQAAA